MHIRVQRLYSNIYGKWNLWDINLLSTIKLNSQNGKHSFRFWCIFLFLCTSLDDYLHARFSTKILTVHDKLFVRLFIQNQFPLYWSTAKTEKKRMHGRVGVSKCLKYNFYDKNEWKHLDPFITGNQSIFCFGSDK